MIHHVKYFAEQYGTARLIRNICGINSAIMIVAIVTQQHTLNIRLNNKFKKKSINKYVFIHW